MANILEEEYEILEAADGKEALEMLPEHIVEISTVLLDIVKPCMNGLEVLAVMNQKGWIEDIPVIIISAESDSDQVKYAYDLGAADFITRPFDARLVHRRVVNTILLYSKQRKGMTEEFQTHIFDSFTREDSKRVQKTEGTGLGMAITKYIVDAMGGKIEVNSTHGVDTEFNVTLDFERTTDHEEDMILPDFTMPVVDDDQQLCESTTTSLKFIGIRADWTLDGETAGYERNRNGKRTEKAVRK